MGSPLHLWRATPATTTTVHTTMVVNAEDIESSMLMIYRSTGIGAYGAILQWAGSKRSNTSPLSRFFI